MEGDLTAFVERSRDLIERSPEMSARTTDLRIVLPFLETLGWDVHGEDVEAEHPVEADGETVTVDYALHLDGSPEVFLATAGCGAPIDKADARRVETAMDAAEVGLGLVTNGRSYAFLAGEDDRERRECDLPDLPDRPSVLRPYTRPAAEHRREQRRSRLRETSADSLDDRREELVTAVRAALVDPSPPPTVAEELGTAGEAFVDRVVDALSAGEHPRSAVADAAPETSAPADPDASSAEGPGAAPSAETPGGSGSDAVSTDRDSDASTAAGEGAVSPTDAESTTASPAGDATGSADSVAEDATGSGSAAASDTTNSADGAAGDAAGGSTPSEDGEPAGRSDEGDGEASAGAAEAGSGGEGSEEEYVVRFFDGSSSVGAVGHGTPEGALVQTVEYLIDQHAIDRYLDLPWGPTEDRAVINREPVHPDGSEMVESQSLSNGYQVCTTIGTDAIRNVVDELADGANLRVMYQGDW